MKGMWWWADGFEKRNGKAFSRENEYAGAKTAFKVFRSSEIFC